MRWSQEIGLDSIEYFKFTHANPVYQFTHANPVYQIEEKANENITQVAPFLVNKGEIIPVHILYIDEIPVYFSQTQHLERYSFAVNPGKHSQRFRTRNQLISVDSVIVNSNSKLIVSFNADSLLNKRLRYSKMPDTLTTYEAKFLSNFFISVANNFDGKRTTLRQYPKVFLHNPIPEENNRLNYPLLIGPVPYSFGDFNSGTHEQSRFHSEAGYSYLFEPGLITKTAPRSPYLFKTHLSTATGARDFGQQVLTNNEVDIIWQKYLDLKSHTTNLFPNQNISSKNYGKLLLGIPNSAFESSHFIKNIILYRYNNPDYIRIYKGGTTNVGYLEPGKYRLFFLLKNNAYFIK